MPRDLQRGMEFHHYAEAPRNVADDIIASRAKA
jgi:elongation factor G